MAKLLHDNVGTECCCEPEGPETCDLDCTASPDEFVLTISGLTVSHDDLNFCNAVFEMEILLRRRGFGNPSACAWGRGQASVISDNSIRTSQQGGMASCQSEFGGELPPSILVSAANGAHLQCRTPNQICPTNSFRWMIDIRVLWLLQVYIHVRYSLPLTLSPPLASYPLDCSAVFDDAGGDFGILISPGTVSLA